MLKQFTFFSIFTDLAPHLILNNCLKVWNIAYLILVKLDVAYMVFIILQYHTYFNNAYIIIFYFY